MLGVLLMILAGVLAVVLAIGLTFFVGMRRRSPTVLRIVRAFARTVVNPRMLVTAGTPGASAAVVHHVGRRTARAYRTPVDAEPTDDGFVIALPYGTSANWVKNVLAAGSATIVHEGVTHRVERPELVPLASVADHFPVKTRRSLARFRVDRCMRLRTDPSGFAEVPADPPEAAARLP